MDGHVLRGRTVVRADRRLDAKEKLVFEGQRIGQFVNTARSSYKAGTLSASRIALFESLPGWSWAPKDEWWESHFAELKSSSASTARATVWDGSGWRFPNR